MSRLEELDLDMLWVKHGGERAVLVPEGVGGVIAVAGADFTWTDAERK